MRTEEIILEYQNLINAPMASTQQLYAQSCSNDTITVNAWRTIWVDNAKANKQYVGSFSENSVGQLFGKSQYMPGIVVGSGPSLKRNAAELVNAKGIPIISCLHNFHYLEDLGVKVDYYVSLDAGPVTIEEVSEGGSKTPEEYWDMTKNKVLIAYIGSHPDLIKKWKGKIYFFNVPVPDHAIMEEIAKIESFHTCIGTGGNVLGACLYLAKAVLGCSQIAFIGADFCFASGRAEDGKPQHQFHAWTSKYDKNLGQFIYITDVFGIKRKTWQSYANFKAWFDYVAQSVPGIYYNCSEGGCLGSYAEGNISAFRYMDLKEFLDIQNINRHVKDQCEKPELEQKVMLF